MSRLAGNDVKRIAEQVHQVDFAVEGGLEMHGIYVGVATLMVNFMLHAAGDHQQGPGTDADGVFLADAGPAIDLREVEPHRIVQDAGAEAVAFTPYPLDGGDGDDVTGLQPLVDTGLLVGNGVGELLIGRGSAGNGSEVERRRRFDPRRLSAGKLRVAGEAVGIVRHGSPL